jgi:hypothetical protein
MEPNNMDAAFASDLLEGEQTSATSTTEKTKHTTSMDATTSATGVTQPPAGELGSVSSAPKTTEKSLTDSIVDWASENPITALLATVALGSIGYSMYKNANKPEPVFHKHKKRSSKKYIPMNEDSNKSNDKAKEETKEPFSFAKTFGSYFKQDPEKKDSLLDVPNTIAAVTTAAATATLATTKLIPTTYVALAGGAIAGIGFMTASPIVMIAGAGLLAGSILKLMLGKTVKPEAGQSDLSADTSVAETNAMAGVPEYEQSTHQMNGTVFPEGYNGDFQGHDPLLDSPDPVMDVYTTRQSEPNLNGVFPRKKVSLLDDEDYDFDRM